MIDIRVSRTVPQIPTEAAARFEPVRPTPRRGRPVGGGMFPVARHIIEAEGDRQRAAILLRLPDDTLLTKGAAIQQACADAGFALGVAFLDVRISVLLAKRDRDGKLPEQYLRQVETWRRGFVALANGVKA